MFHLSRRELKAVALPAEHGGWSFLAEPAILGLALGAVAVATGLAAAGLAPWLSPPVFLVLLARSGWGLSPGRSPVRPQALVWQEVGYGALTLVLLAVGYRVGF